MVKMILKIIISLLLASVILYSSFLLLPVVIMCKSEDNISQYTESKFNNDIVSVSDIKLVSDSDINIPAPNRIRGIAHRGYTAEAPENTLSSFLLAKQKGFSAVEADVVFTSDDIPLILHDYNISQTGNGLINIRKMTYNEVMNYDFDICKNEKYAEETIPTFEALIKLCHDQNLEVYVEIKKDRSLTGQHITMLYDIVCKYDMQKMTTWISFNSNYLSLIKDMDPTARLGYICKTVYPSTVKTAAKLKTEENYVFIDAEYNNLTNNRINYCKEADIPLEIWFPQNFRDTVAIMSKFDPYITGVTANYCNYELIVSTHDRMKNQ